MIRLLLLFLCFATWAHGEESVSEDEFVHMSTSDIFSQGFHIEAELVVGYEIFLRGGVGDSWLFWRGSEIRCQMGLRGKVEKNIVLRHGNKLVFSEFYERGNETVLASKDFYVKAPVFPDKDTFQKFITSCDGVFRFKLISTVED